MTARRTAKAVVEPPAPPVATRCRRCARELPPGRTVLCSDACVTATDGRATSIARSLAAVRADLEQRRAVVEAEIARHATFARRVLLNAEADVARMSAELAPLTSTLSDSKAAGEVRGALASDALPVLGAADFA